MKKTIPLVVVLLLLTACATTANYEIKLRSWVGKHADQLVMSWGAPDSVYALTSGETILKYSRQGQKNQYQFVSVGGQTSYVPAGSKSLNCETEFKVSSNGIINAWKYRGNNCKAYKPQN